MLAGTYKESFSDLLFHDGRPILEIKIEYLRATGQITAEFEKAFNAYCERKARMLNLAARNGVYGDALAAYSRAKKQGLPFNIFSVSQTAEMTFVSEKYLSVTRKISTYTGGAHEYTRLVADVWSLSKAQRLTLREVSGLADGGKTVLNGIKQKISEDRSGKFFHDAAKAAVRSFDPKDFFLTDKGISVFYPVYTLAPYYAGIQIFETGITPI